MNLLAARTWETCSAITTLDAINWILRENCLQPRRDVGGILRAFPGRFGFPSMGKAVFNKAGKAVTGNYQSRKQTILGCWSTFPATYHFSLSSYLPQKIKEIKELEETTFQIYPPFTDVNTLLLLLESSYQSEFLVKKSLLTQIFLLHMQERLSENKKEVELEMEIGFEGAISLYF